jgi:hypothetical protein
MTVCRSLTCQTFPQRCDDRNFGPALKGIFKWAITLKVAAVIRDSGSKDLLEAVGIRIGKIRFPRCGDNRRLPAFHPGPAMDVAHKSGWFSAAGEMRGHFVLFRPGSHQNLANRMDV